MTMSGGGAQAPATLRHQRVWRGHLILELSQETASSVSQRGHAEAGWTPRLSCSCTAILGLVNSTPASASGLPPGPASPCLLAPEGVGRPGLSPCGRKPRGSPSLCLSQAEAGRRLLRGGLVFFRDATLSFTLPLGKKRRKPQYFPRSDCGKKNERCSILLVILY